MEVQTKTDETTLTPPPAPIATAARTVTLHCDDNLAALKKLPDNSIDAVVTDPPYGLSQHTAEDVTNALKAWVEGKEYQVKKRGGFMGKTWDSFVPGPELWREVLRVIKPGGHCLVFAGSRTDDLMGIAMRLAGFEVRDKVMWLYGTGFPKSYNVAKGIEGTLENGSASWNKWRELDGEPEPMSWGITKMTFEQGARPNDYTEIGQQRIGKCNYQHDESAKWDGWGTALKPAFEPIIVARKPLEGTVAANVLKHGVGGINIDGCRVAYADAADMEQARVPQPSFNSPTGKIYNMKAGEGRNGEVFDPSKGRWPANVIHDGSDEVEEAFAVYGDRPGTRVEKPSDCRTDGNTSFDSMRGNRPARGYDDNGSASRFFYSAKASKTDRDGSKHPTVKPISLMRYLVRLVTPPGGTVLDPFAGSGTTGAAAIEEGFSAILMERETEYQQDIVRRFDKIVAKDPTVSIKTVQAGLTDDED